jgi:hypothetical protein
MLEQMQVFIVRHLVAKPLHCVVVIDMNNIKCPTHGDIPQNQWGCPECVKELREENIKLKRLLNKPPKKDGWFILGVVNLVILSVVLISVGMNLNALTIICSLILMF